MTNRKEMEAMLTVSDVAYLLNVHINTVRRWSNQRILKSYRVGSRGDRRFRQGDIADFLAQESKIAVTTPVQSSKVHLPGRQTGGSMVESDEG
ncbi:MAG: hypothetical protein DDT30_02192 [Dehalococcoidia bacterium]|nr:hypothetical protein [Bacillota bacterium]MBT9144136.1 hypothetical protein [Bacillota bacterium]